MDRRRFGSVERVCGESHSSKRDGDCMTSTPLPYLVLLSFTIREPFVPYPHFTDKEMESWRGAVSRPGHADPGQGHVVEFSAC